MRLLASLLAGLKSLLSKEKVDRELDEELDGFLEASAEHKRSTGMAPDAARRAAFVELGSRSVVKHQVWSSRWEGTFDGLVQDLRVSLRALGKSPGFTAIALLSLALGIGGNTAIFTLINQVLLRHLPVRQPEQLVSFGNSIGGGVLGGIDLGTFDMFTYDFAKQLQTDPGPFTEVAAYDSGLHRVNVRSAGVDPTQASSQAVASLVSGNYFSAIGADAMLGRTLNRSDETTAGANAVAVVSYHYWQETMSADPSALGKNISINGTPFAVVGVMQEPFHGISQDLRLPDIWVPLTMQPQVTLQATMLEPRSTYFLHMFAREQPGMKRTAEQQWLDRQIHDYIRAGEGTAIATDRQQEIERESVKLVSAANGISALRSVYGDSLQILMGVVGMVLLIACANLANFVQARAATRQREIATRLALGSSRARIVRQGLVETLVLSLAGGLLGLGVAFAATRTLIAFVAKGATYTDLSAAPNGPVLLFTLAVSLATGLLFGLAPALIAAKASAAGNLSSTTRSAESGGGRKARIWPKALVSAQVMLSLLLLVGAGLLLRTLKNLQEQNYGFERKHLLIAEFDARLAGYKPEATAGLHQRMLEGLAAIPGVKSAALSLTPPISSGAWSSSAKFSGYVPQPKEDMSTILNRVSGQYFETVGIPIVAGRGILPSDSESALKVVVVNETIARHFFTKGDALGQSVEIASSTVPGPWRIVGIAKDTKSRSPRDVAPRMVYLPIAQIAATAPGSKGPEPNGDRYATTIELRTVSDPAQTVLDLRSAMAAVDPNLPVLRVHTISEELDGLMSREALISRLTAIFSLLALVLAGIGLYGVMNYNVIRRTPEIGIRLALGAKLGTVQWMVLRESLGLLAIGIGLGLPVTIAATTLIRKQLFELNAIDPVTFGVAIAVVTGMTLFAAWLPARRATRIDPMAALRAD